MKEPPRVAVLGPTTVGAGSGSGTADLPGPTARALLVSLTLNAGRPRGVEALAAEIWADDDLPQNPRGSLQTLVSRLRAAGGADLISSGPSGYALTSGDDTDLARGRALEAAASRLPEGDPARLTLAEEGLELWRGDVGADLGGSPVAAELVEVSTSLRERLEDIRSRTLVAVGRAEEALASLRSRAAAHPYDEGVHVRLMEALAAADRSQEAVVVFAELRERLGDELGSAPGATATALNTRILRGEATPHAAPLRIGLRSAANALIGRDDDLTRVAARLARARMVTILGAGGLGKTRLAQAVAAASDAPAVAVIPLASIRADADLEPAIGAGLGISENRTGSTLADARSQPDLRARIVALLAERPALLVLDNCEQIVDAVAAWTSDVLALLPDLRILATSRTPIAISAETVYPLAPLPIGESGDVGPAVRLFLERASAVRPDATLPPEVIARLCRRLDGLPLAIELAAARMRTMTAQQIESRLENRFALLTSADRSAPERHRTLQAVIEWSWDLLDPDARRALARLALLPSGFSAVTAAAVLGDGLVDDLLDRLVGQSLLVVTETPEQGGVRFRMLETVREFGLSRLRDEEEGWDAVLRWASSFSRAPGAGLFGAFSPLRPDVLRELNIENDNLVAALRRSIDTGRGPEATAVFAALTSSWVARGAFTELIGFTPSMMATIADMPDDAVPADVLAPVLLISALMAMVDDGSRSLRTFHRIRRLRNEAADLSPAWAALAEIAATAARPDRMAARLAEHRLSPDPSVRLVGEFLTAQSAENEGEAEVAGAAAQRAWELAQSIGDHWLSGLSASSAAQVASQSAHPTEALIWLDRARRGPDGFDDLDERRQQDWVRGVSLVSLGRLDEAERLFEQLTHVTELTPQGLEFASVGWVGLAETDRARGLTDVAAVHYERAMTTFRSPDQRASPWYLLVMSSFVSAAVLDGFATSQSTQHWARRLRTRMLAIVRMRSGYIDRPVLGTTLAGWSSWALTQPALQDRGLLALALAEALGGRQDLPSLHLDVLRDHASSIVGRAAVAAERARVAGYPTEELTARALRVFDMRETPRAV
ncbi:ATP-binding protein [Microbacterium paraoxydans]|uniref:ATP-binding protein n=1 Tax=Microbacterium paraoxydans TaxID=199592 RepID=UPI001CFC1546|nr:BTAD domain-containing putative transcriptional regulator [Microbacterium paraoxydans]